MFLLPYSKNTCVLVAWALTAPSSSIATGARGRATFVTIIGRRSGPSGALEGTNVKVVSGTCHAGLFLPLLSAEKWGGPRSTSKCQFAINNASIVFRIL